MTLNFDDLPDHIIPMKYFGLKWRFTDEKYDKLPNEHLEQLKPFDKQASNFLSDYINAVALHDDLPFKKDLFRTIDKTRILVDNEKEIKKWLYHHAIPFDRPVFLCWNNDNAMIVPWKIFIKYFDSFYYSGSDDLTIIDNALQWALLFHHEDDIYFGTNDNYEPSAEFQDINFIW